ncbi:dihydrofolate reductase [Pedobacter sp. CAN_A7]|uniref:dihydrofolate reductase family protein n=1 Tax=Pedobacter sp. CAN_A7 TaxID=2787722 RepID=UPI0018CBAF5E
MRKIIVSEFMTLDGVIQAPGSPEEDPSGGFQYGGWSAPYDDEVAHQFMEKQMEPADLLLGRKTFDIFASYWPSHADQWPGINEVTKYVISTTKTSSDWENSLFLKHVEDIEKLKKTEGTNLVVWGSSELVQLLLMHDLIDELWLKIYPVMLGKGKKLYNNGAFPAAFTLSEHVVTTSGVIMANYVRAGEVTTGTMA